VTKLQKVSPRKMESEAVGQLRKLSHDLSNSLEIILQASYLLGEASLEGQAKEWVKLVDSASQDAVRVNREMREILRAQI